MITVRCGCGVQDDGDGDVHSDSEDGEMVRMRMSVCMQRGRHTCPVRMYVGM
jgi:hypothetical protein